VATAASTGAPLSVQTNGSCRIGEARDQTRRVVCTGVTHRAHHAGGAERYDAVPRPGADAQRRGRIVAGTGSEDGTPRGLPRRLIRSEDRRKMWVAAAQRKHQQVRVVFAALRGEVTGATGVAAVGVQRRDVGSTREPPGEPVVRQTHRSGCVRVPGLVVGQPAELGCGDRRNRHHADLLRPFAGPTELGDQIGRGAARPRVVPQQGIPHHRARRVETDHAVLLRAYGDGSHVVEATGSGDRGLQRRPPMRGVDLGASGVGLGSRSDGLARIGVAHDDLAGLGG
jgi:hypothetical protein